MKSKPFVHLHTHTCYSLLDGAAKITPLVEAALEAGMPALAMTDHGVMYGAIDFYQKAHARGLKPIIGCETYITTGSRHDKNPHSGDRMHHLVLLAKDVYGYQNLTRLISKSHLEGFYYKPRIDYELLQTYHEGLIGLSACLKGEVASTLLQGSQKEANQIALRYQDIFGKNHFYLEIMDHGIADQRRANMMLKQVAHDTGIPLVATNDVHYLKQAHAEAHELLLALQTQTVMSDPKRMRYESDQFYLKTREEMERLFRDCPDAIERTVDIAEMCNLELEFGKLHFPTYVVPQGTTQKQYLIELGFSGLKRHYGLRDPEHPGDTREKEIMERFWHEVDVIETTGFINYFLVVWDFVRFAHEQRIPVGPGRGSGGGSILAYALDIIAIDPLRYGLIFERFLNPERVSPPDFDIDFCQSRRGEVIEYVKQKYGRENVAQIITFGSLGAKTVIRDVGRALEISYAKCDQLSKMIPGDPKITLEKAIAESPDFKKAAAHDEDCGRILQYAFVLEGLYRNPGTHAAGVVIGEKPLVEIIPLARDKEHEPVTQYTMEPLGDLGLLKMDFLGLKTLTVIQECLDLIQNRGGPAIDFESVSLEDEATYALLNRGDTVGIFQLESGGMRDLIRRIGINNIEELIAVIALYRPGPMEMLPEYIDRKTGKAPIKYDHPDLEPVLRDTYGVMVYQEQVQKAANVLAGYSLGQADILRRAMGKKKKEVMAKERQTFIAGCQKNKHIDKKTAAGIFDNIAQFAGYGFNKAHSAGYGIVSYRTAFLKANYPAEFMAALISSEIGGDKDKFQTFIQEANEMGHAILAPSVQESGVRFMPCTGGIRFGLAGIKNVGAGAAGAIVAERNKNGPYLGLTDFCSRIDSSIINKKSLESLIRCGAFDPVNPNRACLFHAIDFAMARAAERQRDRESGQGSLFQMMDIESADTAEENLPECPPWPQNEQLAAERELLSVYMTGHPLSAFTGILERYQLSCVQELQNLSDRTPTRIGGLIADISCKVSKRTKETWAILRLEDLDGTVEVLVYSETYRKYASTLQPDQAVMICGDMRRNNDTPQIEAREIYPLHEVPDKFSQRLSLHLPVVTLSDERLRELRDILSLNPGSVPVVLCLQFPEGQKVFIETDQTLRVCPEPKLVHQLEHLLGESAVFVAIKESPCLHAGTKRHRGAQQIPQQV